MPSAKLALQINLLFMVLLSGLLLGWSMESIAIVVVAFTGATLGFVLCDWYKLFRIEGILANVVTLCILVLVMWDFFLVSGAQKLVAVATMLTYLTNVLMFQRKTPRLIWQLFALSLLQVVLGAIFSWDLEAGIVFLCYFFVAGLALFQQSIFIQRFQIESQNIASAKSAKQQIAIEAQPPTGSPHAQPLVFFDTSSQPPLSWKTLLSQLALWGFLTFAFATTLFHITSRHTSPWRGPASAVSTVTAGISQSVDLNERGTIRLSPQVMFRASFTLPSGYDFQPANLPYFRGLALSNLIVQNNQTDFQAPYDRIDREHYQDLDGPGTKGRPIEQHFLVEASADPLLYNVYPAFKTNSTRSERVLPNISFCHEISCITRKRLNQSINVQPFEYQTTTYVDHLSRFYRSWPYLSNHASQTQKPMSADQPQHDWLTQIDATRYRNLSALSDRIAAKVKQTDGGRIEFLKATEDFFLRTGGFRYTLDYSQVPRNEKLDPVEDFVRNHRSGHCEQFAAATTLMLRRQNIPARLVVGYHGGEFNALTGDFTVRALHAHAWVEAYLRPEDCTTEMVNNGSAGPGGAWMIVESTPAVSDAQLESTDEAIDLARTVWQDYVLGRDTGDSHRPGSSPVRGWIEQLDLELLNHRLQSAQSMAGRPQFKFIIATVIGLIAFIILIRQTLKSYSNQSKFQKKGVLRRMVASAVSLFSTQLAQWVMGDDDRNAVKFYQTLEKILASQELHRHPTQSHLEFAKEIETSFSQHPQYDFIRSTVYEITVLFNAVRFGNETIDATATRKVDDNLAKLQSVLSAS